MTTAFLTSKFSGYLALVGILSSLLLVLYIYNEGKSSCVSQQQSNIIAKVEKYEKKKAEIRSLDDDALVKRYCRWVYDLPYDKCVTSYTFVE